MDVEYTLSATKVDVNGVVCEDSMLNSGAFGAQYDAQLGNVNLISGRKSGGLAGRFRKNSRFAIYGMGPFGAGEIVSLSLWFKTSNDAQETVLVHYGNGYNPQRTSKDWFTLTLAQGSPVIYFRPNFQLVANQELNIADKKWHQIAVSYPSKSCLMSEVDVYIDKKRVDMKMRGEKDKFIFHHTNGSLSIGGFGYEAANYQKYYSSLKPFRGRIDEFSLYARPLSHSVYYEYTLDHGCAKGDEVLSEVIYIPSGRQCSKKCTDNKECQAFELTEDTLTCIHFYSEVSVGLEKVGTRCSVISYELK